MANHTALLAEEMTLDRFFLAGAFFYGATSILKAGQDPFTQKVKEGYRDAAIFLPILLLSYQWGGVIGSYLACLGSAVVCTYRYPNVISNILNHKAVPAARKQSFFTYMMGAGATMLTVSSIRTNVLLQTPEAAPLFLVLGWGVGKLAHAMLRSGCERHASPQIQKGRYAKKS